MTAATIRKITQYMSRFEERSYKKGQVLIFGNEPMSSVYYLAEGQVRQYDISYRGDEVVVNVLCAPCLFPLSAMIKATPNRYFFEACGAVSIYRAPVLLVKSFLKSNPDVVWHLLDQASVGADNMFDRLAHIMGGSAHSRVLYELLTQSRLIGQKRKTLWHLAINETEIAARCGLSRETVSREMHKLKEAGLLDITRKGIVLRSPELLAEKLRSGL